MKTGRYSLKDLLTHNEIEQIIVPEIQRDYVWTPSNVRKLLESIIHSFDKKEITSLEIKAQGEPLKEESIISYLQTEYDKLKFNLKIGFIYAYHDSQYAGKFFLIDGQQRITTLYLILLALYKKKGLQADFKTLYFKEGKLKLDYKVREASHDFLLEFVTCELDSSGKGVETSTKFYKSDYEKDETIKNIRKNYAVINEELDKIPEIDSLLDYIENFIELNYFDTHLSEQGEQLYIYMNSRGESLSYQEIIRAEIVNKERDTKEKKKIGIEWEEWQNYFWINRGFNKENKSENNESADKGFEEFLKWATIIHMCSINPDSLDKGSKEIYLTQSSGRKLEQEDVLSKYQIKYITADYLKKIFSSVQFLFSKTSKYIPVSKKWLCNNIKTIDYVVLCPLLFYLAENKWDDEFEKLRDAERLAMFLKNITYFEGISKNPDSGTIDALEIVKGLCDTGKMDLIYLSQDKDKGILNEFEKFKISQYESLGKDRVQLEKFIWDITLKERLSEFLRGNISILFETIDDKEDVSEPSLRVELLYEYSEILDRILKEHKLDDQNDNADLFRRALLTFEDDYLFETAASNRFGKRIEGYSFGYYYNKDNREWLDIINDPKKSKKVSEILYAIRTRKLKDLKILIDEYTQKDWKEPFIRFPGVLDYCKKKRILWENDNRIILISEKEKGYLELQCFLLGGFFGADKVTFHDYNICSVTKDDYPYNFNFKYDKEEWSVFITCEHEAKRKVLFEKLTEKEWTIESHEICKYNKVIYTDDNTKSIVENIQEVLELAEKFISKNLNLI